MDAQILRFLIFTLVSVAALAFGYSARRFGWLPENASRRVHFHTLVWAWSAAAFLSVWHLDIRFENLWVIVIEAVVIAVPAIAIIPFAKWIGCQRRQIPVMAVGAGAGNIGWTLGGYLCYAMIQPHRGFQTQHQFRQIEAQFVIAVHTESPAECLASASERPAQRVAVEPPRPTLGHGSVGVLHS